MQEFDTGKAIALLVVWGKRAIALSDKKGDRFWERWMERSDRPLGYLGKRAIALLSQQKLKQLVPVNTWAAVNSVAKGF